MKKLIIVSVSLLFLCSLTGWAQGNQAIYNSDNELLCVSDYVSVNQSSLIPPPLRATLIDYFDLTPEYQWSLNADFAWANVFDTNDITGDHMLTEFQYHAMPTLGVTYEFYVTTDNGGYPDDANLTFLTSRSDLSSGSFDWITIDISAAGYVVEPGKTYWFIRTCPIGGWPGFTWSSATNVTPPVNPPVKITQSFPVGGWGGWVTDWWMLFKLYGEPAGGLTLSVDQLVGGQTTTIDVTGAVPYDTVIIAYSRHGGGPITTPWGTGYLTPPYVRLPAQTANGSGSVTYAGTCPNLTGLHLWFQCLDFEAGVLSNGWDGVIQ